MNFITTIGLAIGVLIVASLIGIPIGIWRVNTSLKKLAKKYTPENMQELMDIEKKNCKEVKLLKNARKEKLRGRKGYGSGYIVPIDKNARAKRLANTRAKLEGIKGQLREQEELSLSKDNPGTTED